MRQAASNLNPLLCRFRQINLSSEQTSRRSGAQYAAGTRAGERAWRWRNDFGEVRRDFIAAELFEDCDVRICDVSIRGGRRLGEFDRRLIRLGELHFRDEGLLEF